MDWFGSFPFIFWVAQIPIDFFRLSSVYLANFSWPAQCRFWVYLQDYKRIQVYRLNLEITGCFYSFASWLLILPGRSTLMRTVCADLKLLLDSSKFTLNQGTQAHLLLFWNPDSIPDWLLPLSRLLPEEDLVCALWISFLSFQRSLIKISWVPHLFIYRKHCICCQL